MRRRACARGELRIGLSARLCTCACASSSVCSCAAHAQNRMGAHEHGWAFVCVRAVSVCVRARPRAPAFHCLRAIALARLGGQQALTSMNKAHA
eukprot:2178749-Pleurochrysis_carterae.AAC.9